MNNCRVVFQDILCCRRLVIRSKIYKVLLLRELDNHEQPAIVFV